MKCKVDTKELKLRHKAGVPYGIKEQFLTQCQTLSMENVDNEITGKINIRDARQLLCDFNVIVVMKVLLKTGMTEDDNLAKACRGMFQTIMKSDSSYITTNTMLSVLPTSSYEEKQLTSAIKEFIEGERS